MAGEFIDDSALQEGHKEPQRAMSVIAYHSVPSEKDRQSD
jgi:hypothetical protein